MRRLLSLLVLITLCSPCTAVVYVKYDSAGPILDGNGWDTAYHTIQAGVIDAATTGEEVWVAHGTYAEKVTVNTTLTLKGGFSGDADQRDPQAFPSVIDGGDHETSSKTVVLSAAAAIDGFIITGGYYGIFNSSTGPTISNNVISGNTQAGVWLFGSSATVAGNIIESNGSFGVMCWSPGTARVTHNTIRGNNQAVACYFSSTAVVTDNFITLSGNSGVYCQSSSPTIKNNRLWQNSLYGIYCASGSPLIESNHILGCGHSGVYCQTSAAKIVNNIIAGNTSLGIVCDSGSSATVTNNTVYGSLGGVGSYNSSPTVTNNIFVNNYYGITKSGGGSPTFSYNCVYGSGPFNYAGTTPGTGDISADPVLVSPEMADFHVQPDSPCRDAGLASAPAIALTDVDGQPRSEVTVDIGADESYGEIHTVTPRIVHVGRNAAPGGDGAGWDTAYSSIQDGVDDVALNGPAEIWVAEGTYPEKVVLWPFAHLYGGFAGTESSRSQRNWSANPTIIDASIWTGETSALYGANVATIDGLTLRGAYRGVYAYYSAPMISHNTISDNSYAGVGVYYSSPAVVNNVIAGNTGNGVVCSYSYASVINNTIVGSQTGLMSFGSVPLAVNNILAFNDFGVSAGNPILLFNNDVFGNGIMDYSPALLPHSTDISADPLFADPGRGDYHIMPASPCINSGSLGHAGVPLEDIDGQGRICWDAVDMGADELWPRLVKIDIKPGEYPNRINLKGRGLVSVAVISEGNFDATRMQLPSITFAGAPVAMHGKGKYFVEIQDVNGDGRRDLTLKFDTALLTLPPTASSASLEGLDALGWPVQAWDSLMIVH